MTLPNEEFQTPRRSLSTIRETPSQAQIQKDPLIAKGLQKGQYLGIVALAIALVTVIGFFSRRVEYAILLAIVLSVILIGFFLTL